MIKIRGDVELNLGPKQRQDKSLSICYWNLNDISVNNFQKLELLQSRIWSNKVEILCLSQTFLNSDISCDDKNLQLPGFDLIRADYPSNVKRGGACIYYRNLLPLNLCNFVPLYRSPNQSEDDFEKFCDNFELTLGDASATNLILIVVIGDFNKTSFYPERLKQAQEVIFTRNLQKKDYPSPIIF